MSATTAAAAVRSLPSPASDVPRSLTMTFAPSAASASASSRPSPRPAPVTMATFPSRSPMAGSESAPARAVGARVGAIVYTGRVQRRVDLEGCLNFRDLGGYPTADGRRIRWRHVYRSDALHHLTP